MKLADITRGKNHMEWIFPWEFSTENMSFLEARNMYPPLNITKTVPSWWFQLSTHLKNISQNGNLPQVGVKIKNIWNHHLGTFWDGHIPKKVRSLDDNGLTPSSPTKIPHQLDQRPTPLLWKIHLIAIHPFFWHCLAINLDDGSQISTNGKWLKATNPFHPFTVKLVAFRAAQA